MSPLWQWAIALLCVAALPCFLFACLFVALLAARAPHAAQTARAPAPAVSGAALREAAAKHMGAAQAAPMPPDGFPPVVMTPSGIAASPP